MEMSLCEGFTWLSVPTLCRDGTNSMHRDEHNMKKLPNSQSKRSSIV